MNSLESREILAPLAVPERSIEHTTILAEALCH